MSWRRPRAYATLARVRRPATGRLNSGVGLLRFLVAITLQFYLSGFKAKIWISQFFLRLMEPIVIARILELESESINHLAEESLSQGFRFVERLIQDYRQGLNCFDQSGEILLTALVQGAVVGIGGLNRDPYFNDSKIGRLRHLYVKSAWRRHGVGRLLVTQLIHKANQHYQLLTLRTDTPAADEFYQKLGFKTDPSWEHTTHHLQLSEIAYYPLSLH
jgi:GNAT superfamily N-acetyltransferase